MSVSKNRETPMAENKVVIKINYNKDKNRRPVAEPKMITVWRTRRILAAVAILALLVALPVFWFSGTDTQDSNEIEQTAIMENEQSLTNDKSFMKEADVVVNVSQPLSSAPESVKQNTGKSEPLKQKSKRPPAIIYSKRVIRASLNSGSKDKEPFEQVKLPLRLSKNQTIEIFYFNEIKGITNRVLYHLWAKDGHVLDRKPLNVNDSRVKLFSAKTLGYKDKGEWQIQLVDTKGKVFSEVNFLVNPD